MGSKLILNTRQWCILCSLCLVLFLCSVRKSLQAPFFPREAELKGSAAYEYSMVFGIHELASFIVSPLLGKYIGVIGANNMLSAGIFLTSITSICFGILDLINSHVLFIGLAFVVRIVEALGSSAVYTSAFAIIAIVFRNSIATSVAIFQVFLSLGYLVGPTIAGFIFEWQGFISPFVILGFALLLQALVIFSLLPIVDYDTSKADNQVTVGIKDVLALTPVSLNLFATIGAACTVGFFATLEPHLRQFSLRPVAIGIVFLVFPAASLIAAPLVGYLCDTKFNPKGFVIIGSGLIICGFSLIGPAFFVPVDTTLWIICLGLAIHGIGYSSIIVATFTDAIHSAIACGLPNDMGLYGIVSGLTRAAFAIGDSFGPIFAGYLFDMVGFKQSVLFVIIVHAIVVVTMSCNACLEHRPREEIRAIYFHASSCDMLVAKAEAVQDEVSYTLEDFDGEKENLTNKGGENTYGT